MTGGPWSGGDPPVEHTGKILIVDDEPDSLLTARLALAGAGHQTVMAADADRACQCLAGGGIDLVCLDTAMAIGDGPLVLRAATDVAVPVLVVSAGPAPAGAAGHLPKPFRAIDLVEAVGRLISTGGRPRRPGPRG